MEFCENEYSGPIELLDRQLVAFFASRSSTDKACSLALEWAEQISRTEKVVISGFQSPLERKVLDYLLSHDCSVVVALGRELYSRIPSYLRSAYESGRVLFLSYRGYVRHSKSSSQIRNWAIMKLAREVYFAPFESSSMLSTMHYTFTNYPTDDKIVKILK